MTAAAPTTRAAVFGLVHAYSGHSFSARVPAGRSQVATALFQMMDTPDHARIVLTDVGRNAPYREAVQWVADQHLLRGYPDHTFRPGQPVPRATFVLALWKMVGAPGGFPGHGYRDVPGSASYAMALRWAHANHLLDGLAAGSQFKPTKSITRGQVVDILYRLATTEAAWPQAAGDPAPPSTVLF